MSGEKMASCVDSEATCLCEVMTCSWTMTLWKRSERRWPQEQAQTWSLRPGYEFEPSCLASAVTGIAAQRIQ